MGDVERLDEVGTTAAQFTSTRDNLWELEGLEVGSVAICFHPNILCLTHQ